MMTIDPSAQSLAGAALLPRPFDWPAPGSQTVLLPPPVNHGLGRCVSRGFLGRIAAGSSRRSISKLLEPLDRLAARSSRLIARHDARFEVGGQTYYLPRYLFVGPEGGDNPLRVGIFAGIHGDEPEGVYGLIRFMTLLEQMPELATGYRLYAYPVCNPTGFEDNTRHSRQGQDLNREFWKNSTQPEVELIQSELVSHFFNGIISLHTDDTSHGFYGFAHGSIFTKDLIEPALQAVEQILPRNRDEVIDGFKARNGIIRKSYQGTLRAPPQIRPRPFEIVLESPQAGPEYLKAAAFVLALRTILAKYREFIAYAPNL